MSRISPALAGTIAVAVVALAAIAPARAQIELNGMNEVLDHVNDMINQTGMADRLDHEPVVESARSRIAWQPAPDPGQSMPAYVLADRFAAGPNGSLAGNRSDYIDLGHFAGAVVRQEDRVEVPALMRDLLLSVDEIDAPANGFASGAGDSVMDVIRRYFAGQ